MPADIHVGAGAAVLDTRRIAMEKKLVRAARGRTVLALPALSWGSLGLDGS
jgi:hypothetical protein